MKPVQVVTQPVVLGLGLVTGTFCQALQTPESHAGMMGFVDGDDWGEAI